MKIAKILSSDSVSDSVEGLLRQSRTEPRASEHPRYDDILGSVGGFLNTYLKLLVVLGLAGVILLNSAWSELFVFLKSPNAWLLIGIPAAVALVPALLITAYIVMSNPNPSKPKWILGVSFALGGLVTIFALVLNTFAVGYFEGIGLGMALFFFVFVGPLEEGLKILAIHLYPADTNYFESPIDCAVFGAVAGLGFAFMENVIHLVSSGLFGSGNVLVLVLGRAGAGPLHVILTAIAGYYFGRAKLGRGIGYDKAVLLKGWVLVAILHAGYNTIITNLATPGSITAQRGFGMRVVALVALVGFFVVIGSLLESIIRSSRRESDDDDAGTGIPKPNPGPNPGTAD